MTNAARWRNWARTASANPVVIADPVDDAEVSALVRWAGRQRLAVRAVGAGHSFTDCAATDGALLRLDALTGIDDLGPDGTDGSRLLRVGAGIRLRALCRELAARGLALENMGDIDAQSIAGAISTGTHGTGARLGGFATQVRGVRLVTATGDIVDADSATEPELFEVARLSLGCVGILTAVTLRVVPAFTLEAHEAPVPLPELLDDLLGPDGFAHRHDHAEFYWFPYTTIALTKANNRVGTGAGPLHPLRHLLDDELLSNGVFAATTRLCADAGGLTRHVNQVAARALTERRYSAPSFEVFTSPRRVKFRESEWAIPQHAVVDVLGEIDAWLQRTGENVPFPIEVRFAAADNVWLSTAYQRPSAYVAVHQAMGLPYARYFAAVAQIMAAHDGRPHWGKLHRLRADRLRELYPRFDDVRNVRDAVDPQRRFANSYTDRVLGA